MRPGAAIGQAPPSLCRDKSALDLPRFGPLLFRDLGEGMMKLVVRLAILGLALAPVAVIELTKVVRRSVIEHRRGPMRPT